MRLTAPLLAGLLSATVFAAPDPPPLAAAGTQPTQAQAQAAVVAYLRKTEQNPADIERTRFLSGPHLVTGITLGGSREQAWEMCVIVGDSNITKGSPELNVKPMFLRGTAAELTVLPIVNWKTYESKC
ncbi:MAG: hypothetical protein ABW051_03200 [Burkholderiaceae bacterium]